MKLFGRKNRTKTPLWAVVNPTTEERLHTGFAQNTLGYARHAVQERGWTIVYLSGTGFYFDSLKELEAWFDLFLGTVLDEPLCPLDAYQRLTALAAWLEEDYRESEAEAVRGAMLLLM